MIIKHKWGPLYNWTPSIQNADLSETPSLQKIFIIKHETQLIQQNKNNNNNIISKRNPDHKTCKQQTKMQDSTYTTIKTPKSKWIAEISRNECAYDYMISGQKLSKIQ